MNRWLTSPVTTTTRTSSSLGYADLCELQSYKNLPHPSPATTNSHTHPIYFYQRLRRDGEGPFDPIEWVQRDQKNRTGCTPRRELNSQQGDHASMVQKRRSIRHTPVSGPRCHDARDYRKSPSLINNLTPIAATTTTTTTTTTYVLQHAFHNVQARVPGFIQVPMIAFHVFQLFLVFPEFRFLFEIRRFVFIKYSSI